MTWIPIEAEPKPLTPLQKRILELQSKGMPDRLIRRQLHIRSEQLIEEIYEIRKREAIMAGKLTTVQRAAIYQAWKDGMTPKDLAKQYGVCDQSIYNLIKKLNKAEKEIRETPALAPAPAAEPAEPAITPAAAETENAEKISKNAEEPAAIAEQEKIPDYIWRALDDKLCACNLEIETREQRIAELQEEIVKFEAEREQVRAWMEARR